MANNIPEGFLRLRHIIGDRKAGIPPIIPVSRSSFLQGCKDGRYPKSIKLGPGTTVWTVESIREYCTQAATAAKAA